MSRKKNTKPSVNRPFSRQELQALLETGKGFFYDLGGACEAHHISYTGLLNKLQWHCNHAH